MAVSSKAPCPAMNVNRFLPCPAAVTAPLVGVVDIDQLQVAAVPLCRLTANLIDGDAGIKACTLVRLQGFELLQVGIEVGEMQFDIPFLTGDGIHAIGTQPTGNQHAYTGNDD